MLDWRIPDFAIPSDFKREKHPKSDFLRLSPEPKTPAQVGSGRHQTYFPHGRPTDQKSSTGSLRTYTMISNCEFLQYSASLIIILILAKRKTTCSAYYLLCEESMQSWPDYWMGWQPCEEKVSPSTISSCCSRVLPAAATNHNLEKYILKFKQIHLAMWTNIFGKKGRTSVSLHEHLLLLGFTRCCNKSQFGKIHFEI